jgi:cytochrome c biogenesis protein CcmG/thiol:disulfide interchange protein DsbE
MSMLKLSIVFFLGLLLLSFNTCDSKIPPQTTSTKAPNFTLKDLSGNEVALTKLIGSKPLVLNFWASWCPTCVKKLPQLMDIYNNAMDKFSLVGINLDRRLADAQIYVQKHNINFTNLHDDGGKISALYGVFGIPTMMIINSQGEIINRNASIDDIKLLK